jgi:hypothetical protein
MSTGQRRGRATVTYAIAHAAAWDAGNRSMRNGGRTAWNADDYAACWAEFNQLMPQDEE